MLIWAKLIDADIVCDALCILLVTFFNTCALLCCRYSLVLENGNKLLFSLHQIVISIVTRVILLHVKP